VYYYLLSSLKRRLILELKDSFSKHPLYKKVVPFIQNKFAFDERPHYGIVVKSSSASQVVLASDNFVGYIQSFVMLTYVGQPVYPIEWVREDLAAIRENDNRMPTAPGVYYIEILEAPENPQTPGLFVIDPLMTVTDEALMYFTSGVESEAQLLNLPVQGTVRLWLNHRILLKEGQDYTVDYSTGRVLFLKHFGISATMTADYRYAAPSVGPVEFYWNQSDFKTLPGVIMAFGKRAQKGDKVAVVVYPDRVDTAFAYGGKFELSFDLDVITQDPTQMEEIADLTVMFLIGEKKPMLEFEGIEIIQVSIGGESEESYDETGDTYFYNASVSVQMRADWEIHIPMPLTMSKVTTDKIDGSNGLQYENPSNLYYATAPALVGRNNDFERIA
jgi:hypothetical protein